MLAQTFPPVLHYPPPRFQMIAASNNCSITATLPLSHMASPSESAQEAQAGVTVAHAGLKPGGPCCICGAKFSSTWYGKRGSATKYCRSNACKLAGGYTVGRKRRSVNPDSNLCDSGDSSPDSIYRVSNIEKCLGMR